MLFLMIQSAGQETLPFETPNKYSRVIQVLDDYCYKIYNKFGFMESQED
jgi:hypothetical protein